MSDNAIRDRIAAVIYRKGNPFLARQAATGWADAIVEDLGLRPGATIADEIIELLGLTVEHDDARSLFTNDPPRHLCRYVTEWTLHD